MSIPLLCHQYDARCGAGVSAFMSCFCLILSTGWTGLVQENNLPYTEGEKTEGG